MVGATKKFIDEPELIEQAKAEHDKKAEGYICPITEDMDWRNY